jgi:hypothetical protein
MTNGKGNVEGWTLDETDSEFVVRRRSGDGAFERDYNFWVESKIIRHMQLCPCRSAGVKSGVGASLCHRSPKAEKARRTPMMFCRGSERYLGTDGGERRERGWEGLCLLTSS